MKLKLFSTQRQIRNWLLNYSDTILDKHKTIGEFLSQIIVVKDKKFIDDDIRKIYLFKAIEDIDIQKLGFKKEFLSFSKDSEFIFGFLKELFIEKVLIDKVIISDTYIEYEEHLNLIKEIKEKYKLLLDENGYIDIFLIEDYEINDKLLEGIDEIDIYLDGYLSKFDIEILSKIDKKISIYFSVSKFNKSLIKKMFKEFEEGYKYKIDFNTKEVLEKYPLSNQANIEVSCFSKKFDEINFVFAKIAEFIEEGLNPDKIAVILPDESFSRYLEEFDEFNNLNFAMGRSFIESNLYIKLNAIYSYLVNKDEVSRLKSLDVIEEFDKKDIIEFIKDIATNEELKLIDEELFKIEKFKELFNDKKQYLYFILNRLSKLSFDDKYSGKITVMGVLESRGMKYDGVIITNFNEDVVPNVNSKDLFLNTAIRKKANLPTRIDKENLQKHYYYSIIQNSKKVAISYIKNEKDAVSRFLYELNLKEGKNQDKKYKEVLYKFSKPKDEVVYDEELKIIYPLYPTHLKTLLECPKKYYLSKVLNINSDEKDINFGDVFHKAVEYAVKNKDNINSSKKYYEVIMDKIFQTLNSKKDIYEIRVKFEDGIKKFCEVDFKQMKESKNITEEILKFSNFACKVDRIDIQKDKITLIDYKTGNVEKLLKYPYEFQLTFYYLWAKDKYKNIVVGYYDIQNGKFIEDKPKIEILEEVLKNLPTKVEMAKDIIINNKIEKRASAICKYCQYNVACKRD